MQSVAEHSNPMPKTHPDPAVLLLGRGIRPVRTIYGIGRNYAAHAKELGNPVPDAPVVFLKPPGCLVGDGGLIVLPQQSQDVQHEVEIVLLLDRGGRDVGCDQAAEWIAGYGIGIDVTARDLQNEARQNGAPWAIAKGFDSFAPTSAFVPASDIDEPRNLCFDLTVNGSARQHGCARDMLFDFAGLISYLSRIFTLYPGDLIFTGTPEGVAAIAPGDVLHARLLDYAAVLTVKAIRQQPVSEGENGR